MSKNETQKSISDWKGGLNLKSLQEAEYLSFGWHYYFKSKADPSTQDRFVLLKEPKVSFFSNFFEISLQFF